MLPPPVVHAAAKCKKNNIAASLKSQAAENYQLASHSPVSPFEFCRAAPEDSCFSSPEFSLDSPSLSSVASRCLVETPRTNRDTKMHFTKWVQPGLSDADDVAVETLSRGSTRLMHDDLMHDDIWGSSDVSPSTVHTDESSSIKAELLWLREKVGAHCLDNGFVEKTSAEARGAFACEKVKSQVMLLQENFQQLRKQFEETHEHEDAKLHAEIATMRKQHDEAIDSFKQRTHRLESMVVVLVSTVGEQRKQSQSIQERLLTLESTLKRSKLAERENPLGTMNVASGISGIPCASAARAVLATVEPVAASTWAQVPQTGSISKGKNLPRDADNFTRSGSRSPVYADDLGMALKTMAALTKSLNRGEEADDLSDQLSSRSAAISTDAEGLARTAHNQSITPDTSPTRIGDESVTSQTTINRCFDGFMQGLECATDGALGNRAQAGDIVILGRAAPAEFRGMHAVVTKATEGEGHCTAVPLDANRGFGVGECWPFLNDVEEVSTVGRLEARVVIQGLKSPKQRIYNGCLGTIVRHPREGHPCFIQRNPCKTADDQLPRPFLVFCVRLDDVPAGGDRRVLLELRFIAALPIEDAKVPIGP